MNESNCRMVDGATGGNKVPVYVRCTAHKCSCALYARLTMIMRKEKQYHVQCTVEMISPPFRYVNATQHQYIHIGCVSAGTSRSSRILVLNIMLDCSPREWMNCCWMNWQLDCVFFRHTYAYTQRERARERYRFNSLHFIGSIQLAWPTTFTSGSPSTNVRHVSPANFKKSLALF